MLYSPAVLGSYSPFSTPASLEELLAIPDLRLGCVKGGATYNFFHNAFLHNRDSVLGRIYAEKLDTQSRSLGSPRPTRRWVSVINRAVNEPNERKRGV